jgi:putative oxidoreductase
MPGATRLTRSSSQRAKEDQMNAGRLIARVVIGGLFVGHGTQKLFGWFGGPGPERTSGMMESAGLRPARRNALLASTTETVAGTMLAAGALVPLAAAGLIGVMVTAIRTVHLPNGLWATNGGYELNLVLIAALLALVDGGPGELSVDGALGLHDTDARWAIAALAAGAAGSTVAIELGRRQPEPTAQPAPETPVSGEREHAREPEHAPVAA